MKTKIQTGDWVLDIYGGMRCVTTKGIAHACNLDMQKGLVAEFRGAEGKTEGETWLAAAELAHEAGHLSLASRFEENARRCGIEDGM